MASKRRQNDIDLEVEEIVKRRKFYTIPKDQQKLLDRGNSAYHLLRQGPDGIRANVPLGVLDGLQAQYHRNRAKETSASSGQTNVKLDVRGFPNNSAKAAIEASLDCQNKGSTTTKATAVDAHAQPQPRSSKDRSQHDSTQSSNPQNLQSPEPSSSPGRPFSWSPSPTSHRSRQDVVDLSQRVEETPVSRANVRMATTDSNNRRRAKIDFEFPSDESEEEMEVDIPDAQDNIVPRPRAEPALVQQRLESSPLKNDVLISNTPPCAQPPAIVPSTLVQRPGPSNEQGNEHKRRGRMNAVAWGDDLSPVKVLTSSKTRMPNTKLQLPVAPSSDSTQSSMIVPATLEPQRDRSAADQHATKSAKWNEGQVEETSAIDVSASRQPDHQAGTCQSKTGNEDHSSSPEEIHEVNVTEPMVPAANTQQVVDQPSEHMPPCSLIQTANSAVVDQEQDAIINPTTVANNAIGVQCDLLGIAPVRLCPLVADLDPYAQFTRAYPSYERDHDGCLIHFIRAAAVLDSLRSDRMLKSALYDDFVRAFSGGYVPYVKGSAPGREHQPAFEWYNWKDEDVTFNKGVLNQKNLDFVEATYPNQFAGGKSLFTEDSPEPQAAHMEMEDVRETIEIGQIDQGDETADLELREPELETIAKSNGEDLAAQGQTFEVTRTASTGKKTSTELATAGPAYSRASTKLEKHQQLELGTASQRDSSPQAVAKLSPLRRRFYDARGPSPDLASDPTKITPRPFKEPAAASAVSENRAPALTAAPKPQARPLHRVPSAQMPPPRAASSTSRASSNAPSSSGVRKVSSSAGPSKPRSSGRSYLQKLKMKGGNNEAREAKMRELGRAQRMSSNGSVASSHASPK